MSTHPGLLHLTCVLLGLAAPIAVALDIPPSVQQAEQQRIAVIQKCVPSVVAVMAKGARGGGSGVLVTPDGFALTNYHVTASTGDEMDCGLSDGKLYPAVIVGIDPMGDVSLIKLQGRTDFPAAPLGNSDALRVGEWVLAMGNPFMLATDFRPTVTFGIISGLHRYQAPAGSGMLEYPDCIQTDASINPGNSGGPLFNFQAEVIGINGRISFERRQRVNSGFGYAISMNQIRNFFPALRGGRVVDHATLGATASTSAAGRVVVEQILENSDAYRRGLREDDELVSFAGRPVTSVNEFKNILGTLPANWRVPLVAHRGTEKLQLMVRLAGTHGPNWDYPTHGRPNMPQIQPRPRPPEPEKPGPSDKPEAPGTPGKPESPDAPEAPDAPAPDTPPQIPIPAPTPAQPPAKSAVEKRPGFANFSINREEQTRVLDAFSRFSGTAKTPLPEETWRISGLSGLASLQLKLGRKAATMKIADADFIMDENDLYGPVADDGTAVLRGLVTWRNLLHRGEIAVRQIAYDGQAPWPVHLVDVLTSSTPPVQYRWYFDPGTGSLLSFEMFTEPNMDPYEFIFGKYQEVNGWKLPHALAVRVGDEVVGEFVFTKFDWAGPPPPPEGGK